MTDDAGAGDEEALAEDIDVLIDRAVVRFVDAGSGRIVGSGFLIAPDLVLTCRHVAASKAALDVRCGSAHAKVREVQEDFPGLDLALVALDGNPGRPLATAGVWSNPPVLAGRAAVAPQTGIIGSAPFELKLNGVVSVQYLPDGSVLESAIDLAGAGVVPGASGSPLVDRNARAAVAVVVGGNLSPGVERVWVVPLEQAVTKWPALAAALARNDRTSARYAMLMNARGAAVLFGILSRHKQRNLEGEERFVQGLDVARAGLAWALSGFLASDESLMAVVGASNVGKSWALAAFAFAARPDEVRLMIEARNLVLPGPSLPALIHQELIGALGACLTRTSVEELLVGPEKIGGVLRQAGVETTVVIDGLNEARDQEMLAAWLRQAVVWCGQHGVRLVLSCREESWPQLADSLAFASGRFYRPEEAGPAAHSPEPWHFNLSDFSPDEASQAAVYYGVDAADIGSHPLMYRLARRLQGIEARRVGRYRVLLRYIETQIAAIARRLRHGPSERARLRASLVAFADLLAPGGVGAVPIGDALALVGGNALFDTLVAEGLLSASADHVRFRHDQLADVLRTVSPEMVGAFAAGELRHDEAGMSLATTALLRFESAGEEQQFENAMTVLLGALEDSPSTSLKSSAVRVARSLPSTRLSHIEAICRRLAESESEYFDEASACIADAPLEVALRVRLLLTRAIHAGTLDDTGWPVRMKDWRDPDRRQDFVSQLEGGVLGESPQHHLFVLLQQHRDQVFPVLMEALQDKRRIGKEAMVGTMCAGILFVDAEQQLACALPALLEQAYIVDYAMTVANTLIETHPDACAGIILA